MGPPGLSTFISNMCGTTRRGCISRHPQHAGRAHERPPLNIEEFLSLLSLESITASSGAL